MANCSTEDLSARSHAIISTLIFMLLLLSVDTDDKDFVKASLLICKHSCFTSLSASSSLPLKISRDGPHVDN